jgi:hypothetical protein
MTWVNAGVVTAISAGNYGVFRVYATKSDLNGNPPQIVADMHTAQFANQTAAQTAINTGNIGSIPPLNPDVAQLGYVIVHNSGGGYISSVSVVKKTLQQYQTGTGAAAVAGSVNVTTTNLDKVMSSADTTVQAALETIDENAVSVDKTQSVTGAKTFSAVLTASSGVKTGLVYPSSNGTTAFQIDKADGTTTVVNVDTTNSRVGIGNSAPTVALDVTGGGRFSSNLTLDSASSISAEYKTSGVSKALHGLVASPGDGVAGSVAGDFFLRTASGNLLISMDSGTTTHMSIASTGVISLPNISKQSLGSNINAATEKTTPVDADMVGLMDSAASNVLKKLSWSNIKSKLFDFIRTGVTTAPSTGYIGERLRASSGAISVAASDSDKTAASQAITAGVWRITCRVYLDPGGITVSRMRVSITTGTSLIGNPDDDFNAEGSAAVSGGYVIATVEDYVLTTASSITLNAVVRANYTGTPGATPLRVVLRATRIA